MEKELKSLLNDYLSQVNTLCMNLLGGLDLHNKTELIQYLYMGKERIWELCINNITYKFHGSGCNAYYGERVIQWDFGRRSHWCGIDPWFIARYMKDNRNKYEKYFDIEFIKLQCDKAVEDKEMYLVNGRYYFTIPLIDTFRPQFPNDFDSVIIEYFDNRWFIKRNKELNRFIRKSIYIYNIINDIPDKYIINFLKDGTSIYTVAYNDICYPENAVIIMSDGIIKNLEKDKKF